jgi:hypothetical protein
MKLLRIGAAMCVVLAGLGTLAAQTWTPLTNQPIFFASTALLLTDGRVLVQEVGAREWWTLSPDLTGSYVNGSWTQVRSLPGGYHPLYYASAVLPDGRVVVLGGEYNDGQDWTTLGAIYNPKSNAWKRLTHPASWMTIGDAQSVVLADGTFMVANCCTFDEALLDAKTLTWTPTGTGKADNNNEEGWTLLPNGKVLTVDTNGGSPTTEIYDPATGSWSSAGNTPVQLVDIPSAEVGPAVLRPDGTVLATGATGHNAIYHTASGKWKAAPDFPKNAQGQQLAIADGPAALLPGGNVLCMTAPGVYGFGAEFFEWDGRHFHATVNPPRAASDPSYVGRMLVLPTGQIMLTDGTKDVEIYTSTRVAKRAWVPTITNFAATLTHGKTSTIGGTQFNGLSQGAAYGDDAQSATNYPLVRITNNATGHVFYARAYNHSSMGVATGAAIITTTFQIPAGIELGASQLEVVANGIASSPVSVTIN